jgi:hypothetical protein
MVIPYLAIPHKQWVTGRIDNPTLVPAAARDASAAAYRDAIARGEDPETLKNRCAMGLVLREDGWAQLRPQRERGRVLTKQFVFEGAKLRVNADCARGAVKVALLDPSHEPYEGFGADACDGLHGPDVWHTVTCRGKSDVRALWNKPVRIEFQLHDASLYAFEFAD